jgi:cholesterol oxidase
MAAATRWAPPDVFDATAPPRPRRPLRTDPPEIRYFHTSDGHQLCLTRYRGGDRGPVMLCHGLGVSSGIFTVDTIPTNLVEHLVTHDYDVWLLDYRSSIELATAAEQADGDVIAAIDYPEAVAEVRQVTGADSVQMVVHCFGATVFFMSLLSGALTDVRSAVVSQATPHVDAAALVDLKGRIRAARMLQAIGLDTLDAYTDTEDGWTARLVDRALQLYPLDADERCSSATCHRVSFMYSQLYEHHQLAPATHDTLHELFGVANLTSLEHVLRIVRTGHLVDADGGDVYMPHAERAAIPLRIIHGAVNECFEPAGSAESFEWLRSHNDPALYSRVVVPDFGHIDCIFGERAVNAVYPHIVEHLDQSAS